MTACTLAPAREQIFHIRSFILYRPALFCSVRTVIPHASHEFFEPLLKDGVHLVRLARGGVGTGGGPLARRAVMTSLLPALSELRNDQPRAQRIARAARLFAVGHLSFASVLRYTRVLLGAYGRLYRSPPPGSGDELWRRDDDLEEASRYMRIDNEADLLQIASKLLYCMELEASEAQSSFEK